MTIPLNNGTNACAILSVGLAESILHDTETEAFLKNVPKAVVVTILSLPQEMNKHHNMGKTYDIHEAYEILCQQQLLTYPLEFYEELPHAICTNSFVLAIGCYKGETLYDQHSSSCTTNRKWNGLLLIRKYNTPEVWMSISASLWQRIQPQLNH